MKKQLILLILFLSILTLKAQEKRTLIVGKTLSDSIPVLDVHIVNQNTKIGTITNDNGFFEIPVKVGDSLLISHLNLQNKLIVITHKIISNKNLTIHLDEKTVALNEFTLEKPKSIFYQDPEIITYNGPKISAKTLNLPYANTKVKKDKSIIKFQSGGVVSLDNLISAINGNHRREKMLKKLASEDVELEKIRKQFTDDFFVTDLKIKKEYINQFLNDCVDKNIISIFKSENYIKLTKLLMKESKLFPHKTIYEDTLLTKK